MKLADLMGNLKVFHSLLCLTASFIPSNGQGYLDPCPEPVPCSEVKHLICGENSRCVCDIGTHYDRQEDYCVGYHGEFCSPVDGEGFDYERHCTAHAYCETSDADKNEGKGTCLCDENSGYIPSPQKICRLTFGAEGCAKFEDCNYHSFLTCLDGTCVCDLDPSTQEWNAELRECIVLEGGNCRNRTYGMPKCTDNASCNDDEACRCDANFIPSPGHKCLLDYDQVCQTNEECHPSFECQEQSGSENPKKCLCKDGQIRVNGFCVSLVGGNCSENLKCVDRAICNPVTSTCQCDAGYSESADGYCLSNHGMACSPNEEYLACDGEKFLICDIDEQSESHLKCICDAKYEYYESACLGLVNATCTNSQQCFPNSFCTEEKICGCNEPTEADPIGEISKCMVNFEDSCSVHEPCNYRKFLTCNGSPLQCGCSDPQNMIYSESQGICISLVNGPCDLTEDSKGLQRACVDNAECQEEGETAVCKCLSPGFTPSPERRCESDTTLTPTESNPTTSTGKGAAVRSQFIYTKIFALSIFSSYLFKVFC